MRALTRNATVVAGVGIMAVLLAGCSTTTPEQPTTSPTSSPEAAGGGAPETTLLKISIGANAQDIALDYAIEQGYFKDAGLDVETTVLQSGASSSRC